MNEHTKMGCKRNTPRKPIPKISKKQSKRMKEWAVIRKARINYLTGKYGSPLCEYCGQRGQIFGSDSPHYLGGHHIDGNRANNTSNNCYIVHNSCHVLRIHDHNLKVEQEDFQGKE